MALALLKEPPLSPPSGLGPYRRRDYEQLPEEPRCELIWGSFYVSPSPSALHQMVLVQLLRHLLDLAEPAGALVLPAPLDVLLGDHSAVQPDLIYLSADRRHLVRERVEGAPDLLVEIVSPGTARRDRGDKIRLYAEAGVREYWIVDPGERQIQFLVNRGGRFEVALAVGGTYRSPALAEVTLGLEAFWKKVAILRQ
jgi:Uma2 family endonuclease